jgi:phosphate:Na+ symporter
MFENVTKILFLLTGGLALFLFGMANLSEGLKSAASARLRKILEKSTSSLFRGLIVGTAVTCIIQSSSAMMALLIGLVNAGLIRLRQAIGVVLGANIGTTITAWIVSLVGIFALLSITYYTLPFIAIGLTVMYFCKGVKSRGSGQTLFGLGILLLGLSFIKDASEPLKAIDAFQQWFSEITPLSAILVGLVTCWIIQSSSATIALVEIFAFQGMLSFPVALGLALGADMGTPITGEIAALTGNQTARQTARSHTMFNFFGPVYLIPLIVLGIWPRFIESLFPGQVTQANIMVHIALAHTIYNTFNAILFLPLAGFLEKTSILATTLTDNLGHRIVKFLSRGTRQWPRSELPYKTVKLDQKVLEVPSIAIDNVCQGMVNMLRLGEEAVQKAMSGLLEKNLGSLQEVTNIENTVDVFQKELTEYLAELIQKNLHPDIAQEIPVLIHSINDIEKIGDYGHDMARIAMHCIDEKIVFDKNAIGEIETLLTEAGEMIKKVRGALEVNDQLLARESLKHETQIDRYYTIFREQNIERLKIGIYSPAASVYFLDLLTKFEKIGDHLTNIAQGILKIKDMTKISDEHKQNNYSSTGI